MTDPRRDAPILVWFRDDRRLDDNPALAAALARGRAIVPVFVWSPEDEGAWPRGAASRWWLHHSLGALDETLRARGSPLVIRSGPAREALPRVVAETGASLVTGNRHCEPAARAVESDLEHALAAAGAAFELHDARFLVAPHEARTSAGGVYQVFTPFWKACIERVRVGARHPLPSWTPYAGRVDSLAVSDLPLLPRVRWTRGLEGSWTPGERGARARFDETAAHVVADYETRRDRPGESGTSRLSPHLGHGEIGAHGVWREIVQRSDPGDAPGIPGRAQPFLRQLAWREFAAHLLTALPHLPERPLRPEFERFPWRSDPEGLRAWQSGRTGYPMVDAGMRELWHLGWMHNRVRMLVASFLTKHLLLDWREGARWFWDTLVDADLANNTLGWQWVAGCGPDAAPYFRIFNPALQGERFDPDGAYVRRWVPELARVPARWVHRPWEAPPTLLAEAGVTLGETYPAPIVDHGLARERALAAYASIRGQGS